MLRGATPPLDTYDLSAPDVAATRSRSHAQVLVAEPAALKALDGENIVIKTGSGGIQFLKGAQWADRLPLVVQARLAQALQSSNAFAGVGVPGEGLAIDYQVVAELRAFEVQVSGARSYANVEIFVRLLNDRNGTVRTARSFSATTPVSDNGNDAYVRALNSAFNTAGQEIVTWVDQQI